MHLDDLPETAPIPTLPPTFYDSPALKHLRQGALSKRTAPDAVLHSVLARLSAFTAADLVLPGINGPESPLNYFVAVIAPSGGGKSTGAGIARMLLPAPEHLWDRDDIPVGTGEGAGPGDFPLTVGPVTGDDDCINLGHLTSPAAALARPLSVRRATPRSTPLCPQL